MTDVALVRQVTSFLLDDYDRWVSRFNRSHGLDMRLLMAVVTSTAAVVNVGITRREAILNATQGVWESYEYEATHADIRKKRARDLVEYAYERDYVSEWPQRSSDPNNWDRPGPATWIGFTELQWDRVVHACGMKRSEIPTNRQFAPGGAPKML